MENQVGLGWLLVVLGLGLGAVGAILLLFPGGVPYLGRLPGDIRHEGEGLRFYFPLVSCLVLSLVVSVALWLVNYLLRR
jgi:hypothetical protein